MSKRSRGANVWLRGEVYQYDFQVAGKRYQGSTFKTTEREAAAVARKLKAAALTDARERELARPADKIWTVGEIADIVIDAKDPTHAKAHEYNQAVRYIAVQIGLNTPVTDVTDATVNRLVLAERIKALIFGKRDLTSSKTVHQVIADDGRFPPPEGDESEIRWLDRIYEQLKDLGVERMPPRVPLGTAVIRQNVVNPVFSIINCARDRQGVTLPNRPQRAKHKYTVKYRTRVLTYDEEILLLAAAQPDLRPLILFALESMLRFRYVLDLTWVQIDLPNDEIRFIQKGDRNATREITNPMRSILLDQQGKHPTHVFATPMLNFASRPEGKPFPFADGRCHRDFVRACERAGIRDLHFHDLRRTGATRLYRANKDIFDVQAALGHSHTNTTWLYIGTVPGDREAGNLRRDTMDRLQRKAAQDRANGISSPLTPAQQELAVTLLARAENAPLSQIALVLKAYPDLAPAVIATMAPPDAGTVRSGPSISQPKRPEGAASLGSLGSYTDIFVAEASRYWVRDGESFRPISYMASRPQKGATLHDSHRIAISGRHLRDVRERSRNGPITVHAGGIAVLIEDEADLNRALHFIGYFDHGMCAWCIEVSEAERRGLLARTGPSPGADSGPKLQLEGTPDRP